MRPPRFPLSFLVLLGVLLAGTSLRSPALQAQGLSAAGMVQPGQIAHKKPKPQLVFPPKLTGSVTITRVDTRNGLTLTVKWSGELLNGNQYREVAAPLAGYGLGSGSFTISGGGTLTSTMDDGTPVERDTYTYTGHVTPPHDPEFVSLYFDGTASSPKARLGVATGYSTHRVSEDLTGHNPPITEDTTNGLFHLIGLPATTTSRVSLQPGGVLSVSWAGASVSDSYLNYTLSGSFQGAGAGKISIEGDGVLRDDPDHPETKAFKDEDTFEVHGGSQESTGDTLRLRCNIIDQPPGAKPKTITWTVSGEGSGNYKPPPPRPAGNSQAKYWPLGGNFVPAKPAHLTVTCQVDWTLGSSTIVEQEVQVGVRTDDVVVIGRIDAAGVPLSSAGVGADILPLFPVDHRYKSLLDQTDAAAYLAQLAVPGTLARPNGSGQLTGAEASYILHWLFKYAANDGVPPSFFRNEGDVEALKSRPTGYKLLNHAQITYHTENGSMVVDKVLHQETAIGTTLDPFTRSVPDPGVAGPAEGRNDSTEQAWSLINNGTPDGKAVAGFNHLMAAQGVTWNHIGSRITFGPDQGAGFDVDAQLYPTYTIYASGSHGLQKVTVLPQAANPEENFTNPSYPDGSTDLGLLLRRHFHYQH